MALCRAPPPPLPLPSFAGGRPNSCRLRGWCSSAPAPGPAALQAPRVLPRAARARKDHPVAVCGQWGWVLCGGWFGHLCVSVVKVRRAGVMAAIPSTPPPPPPSPGPRSTHRHCELDLVFLGCLVDATPPNPTPRTHSDVVQRLPAEAADYGVSTSYREALSFLGCVAWSYLCLPLLQRSRSMSVRHLRLPHGWCCFMCCWLVRWCGCGWRCLLPGACWAHAAWAGRPSPHVVLRGQVPSYVASRFGPGLQTYLAVMLLLLTLVVRVVPLVSYGAQLLDNSGDSRVWYAAGCPWLVAPVRHPHPHRHPPPRPHGCLVVATLERTFFSRSRSCCGRAAPSYPSLCWLPWWPSPA
jgi:hypothetical protein